MERRKMSSFGVWKYGIGLTINPGRSDEEAILYQNHTPAAHKEECPWVFV